MPTIRFLPSGQEIDVEVNTKVLAAAVRHKIPLRYGCGAARCGMCGVAVHTTGTLSIMGDDEKALLNRLGLPQDGTVRLACRTRILDGLLEIDLDFQKTYSPSDQEE